MSNEFNIFKILEKDDKELIHSSFLKFLIVENKKILNEFFSISEVGYSEPNLEKGYVLSDGSRLRIDVEVENQNLEDVIIIENKFKSFPNESQLQLYNRLFDEKFSKKKVHKYLLCFDKSLITFRTDWTILDYGDLILFIEQKLGKNNDPAKAVFIEHYYKFLKEYYVNYKQYIIDSRPVFRGAARQENKFWIRLIYSLLLIELSSFFKGKAIEAKFEFPQGSTKVPLINIIPQHWRFENSELLIQFQGDELKLYCHSNNKAVIQNAVELAKNKFGEKAYEYKKLTKKDSGTYFILKTRLSSIIDPGSDWNIDLIRTAIISFYEAMDGGIFK
jgi:hypothetical protein